MKRAAVGMEVFATRERLCDMEDSATINDTLARSMEPHDSLSELVAPTEARAVWFPHEGRKRTGVVLQFNFCTEKRSHDRQIVGLAKEKMRQVSQAEAKAGRVQLEALKRESARERRIFEGEGARLRERVAILER